MLSNDERSALERYEEADRNGAFALQRIILSGQLERRGLIEWKGLSFGTDFYRITDEGREALKEIENV